MGVVISILKILGIILLVILAVLILALLVVLFVPVRYRAKGEVPAEGNPARHSKGDMASASCQLPSGI